MNTVSAASAIRVCPMNSFYVDGRKLTIDQVDLTTAQTEWRLCPNCSHASKRFMVRLLPLVLNAAARHGQIQSAQKYAESPWSIPTMTGKTVLLAMTAMTVRPYFTQANACRCG